MSVRRANSFPFAKIVVVLAVAFGIGLGLCGLSFVAAEHGYRSNEEFGVDSLGIAGVSLIVMLVSAAALVFTLIGWALVAIFGNAKGGSEPQTLLSDRNDEDKPKRD